VSEGITIVAERINGTRKRIGAALESRDAEFIQKEARSQAEAGATYIDLNAGVAGTDEVAGLLWLVKTVQAVVDTPVCLDSANPKALAAALPTVKGTALVNSINGDPARIEGILPLVAEHGASVVALTMEEGGMPETVADRMKIAEMLAGKAKEAGVPMSRVYFDPCVLAASTSPGQPTAVLDTVREIRATWPDTHVISGLSNISFGLPKRALLNRTYVPMMVASGADAFILDPTDAAMRATLLAVGVITGSDDFGMEYIGAVRDGSVS
jgi:5-methyltetrahydrofolate corrinoid/iron sulfur protein methyltransferase